MTNPSNPQWRSRAVIVIIALLSIVPFALAWYVARHPEGWVSGTSNYGALIVPPRPLDYAELFARPVSPAANLQEIKGRWVLLHVASGSCGAICAETLHKTHQVRLMTNKEIPRIKRLLLVPQGISAAEFETLLKGDDALLAAGASDTLIQTLTQAVGKPLADGMVILMDPLGNAILWYDGGFDPYGLLKDLKHLLRASQIG
jgi:hypothetical protein